MASIVVGFGGRSRSGKSYLSKQIADQLKWPRAAFGDHVRAVAAKRRLDPTDVTTLMSIGAELITQDCTRFCSEVLDAAHWTPDRSVILDGVRHVAVVETVQRLVAPSTFRLIVVEASRATRERRLRENAGNGPSLEEVDSHSTAGEVERLRVLADLVVDAEAPSDISTDKI